MNERFIGELEYYYLYSLEKGIDIYQYTYRHAKLLNRVILNLVSNNYVKEIMNDHFPTEKGKQYKKELEKKLEIKGVEKFLIPNFNKRTLDKL